MTKLLYMTKAYLNAMVFTLVCFFIFCNQVSALDDSIPQPRMLPNRPIYFFDGKDVPISLLQEIDPCAIDTFNYIKPAEAAKTYGARGRFGVYQIFSRKKQIYSNGFFSYTLYIYGDSSKGVRQERGFDNNLDSLFQKAVKRFPNSSLAIDDLIFTNKKEGKSFLLKESGAFNILHAQFTIDSVSQTMAELIFHVFKIYKAGRIYFSGAGFKNVASCNATDINCIRSNYKICTTRSIITFESCVYKNSSDGSSVINKVIKLD